MILIFLLVVMGLFGWAGSAIANSKGGSAVAGFWLGALLGPIGLIVAVLLGPSPAEAADPFRQSATEALNDRKRYAIELGITREGRDYCYGVHRFTHLENAIRYVEYAVPLGISREGSNFYCGGHRFRSLDEAIRYGQAEARIEQHNHEL